MSFSGGGCHQPHPKGTQSLSALTDRVTRLRQGYGEPRGVLRAGPPSLLSLCRDRTWPLPAAPRPSHLSWSASREPQIQGSSSVQSLSCVPLFPTPWTAAHQASKLTCEVEFTSTLPITSFDDLIGHITGNSPSMGRSGRWVASHILL